jgi:hypothetical protein
MLSIFDKLQKKNFLIETYKDPIGHSKTNSKFYNNKKSRKNISFPRSKSSLVLKKIKIKKISHIIIKKVGQFEF